MNSPKREEPVGQTGGAGVICRRGGVVDTRHRVHVAAVTAGGEVVAHRGDWRLPVVYRSAAKPFQAVPLVEDGVVDRFGLSNAELALSAASHNGEGRHLELVRSILKKVGFCEEDLGLGPLAPLGEEADAALREAGEAVRPIHNNCSGQHAAMLGLARLHGWDPVRYLDPQHPLQGRMLEEMARFAGMEASEIATMPDGCGMVAFAVPLWRMALSFARLGEAAPGEGSAGRVVDAMAEHPYMLGGRGRLCSALPQVTRGRIVGKLGAEGVYGLMVREHGLGVALKIEDGSMRAVDPAVIEVLTQMGLLSGEEAAALGPYRRKPLRNTLGEVVGEVFAGFSLASGPGTPRE